MSHSREGTAVLASVSSVTEAVAAITAGADLVDADGDEALVTAIRREGIDMLDPSRLVQVEPGEVAAAVAAGWRTLVDVDVAGDADSRGGGGADTGSGGSGGGGGDPRIAAARAGAIAAVCAWQGAHLVRTRYVIEVRRCLDMTGCILGNRPPAWAVRGLG